MATETLKEFRKMAGDELKQRESELRTELFKLRTGEATEKTKDTSKFRKIKKDIARIQTILRQQETRTSQPAKQA
jgi:large subunit ribosomal protein L29